jgi:SpoVK/Ycf46/Vps4 family AAA+-type ATPase
MRFVGNPGTGKTTVARILGKILKENGVLRVGNFYEYSGRDLCGRYIGETAPKTASICRDAYGSVLFIDEAYSLYRSDGNDRDYGREALDTLIAEMENHRDDLVVIMAGYTDDIQKLMEGNLGLASRMPYVLEFPNFSKSELYEIFSSMVKSKFNYDKDMLDAAKKYFENLSDALLAEKEFSNARFVRNLFERTWAKAAMRCQLNNQTEVVLTRDDFERASSDKEFACMVPKKTLIGF